LTADFDYAARLGALRRRMIDVGVDLALLSVGSDLPYFTGYEAMPLERLTMLVVPAERQATLVVPELEAPRVQARPEIFDLSSYGETDEPLQLVSNLAGRPATVAIGDHTWSRFLLVLQEKLSAARFIAATPLTKSIRLVKERGELNLLRRAAAAADRVVGRLRLLRFSGRTERALSAAIRTMTVEEGHDVATFHIVASGPNGASPHHEPGGRVMEEGDAVVVDFGGRLSGYCSDTTRTFHIGKPTAEVAHAYEALAAAQAVGRASVHPGVEAQSVDRATRRVLIDAGFGNYFIHRTGHGIGLDGHEAPYIVEGNGEQLLSGMTFSIEPGIYVPGRFGMRIEDIVVVTATGVEELNQSSRELLLVD
jgi:Xaa-Pro aminopeptidase